MARLPGEAFEYPHTGPREIAAALEDGKRTEETKAAGDRPFGDA